MLKGIQTVFIGSPEPSACLTLCIPVKFFLWFDAMSLGWFIVHIKGSQVRISKLILQSLKDCGSAVAQC